MLPTLLNRKATGSYYTPATLINLLLDHALPLGEPAPMSILDPACGPGDFLIAAQQRAGGANFFGVDTNAAALEQCSAALGSPLQRPSPNFACADALLAPPPFLRDQIFDLVVGNPPFINAIDEQYLSPNTKRLLRAKFPEVTGAADLAAYFLALSIRLIRPGGRIALVLPRPLLNSPTAANLRANLPPYLRPNLIYAPERNDFFPGAKIFITCLILGPSETCLISTDPDPTTATFTPSPPPATHNWWLHLHDSQSVAEKGSGFGAQRSVQSDQAAVKIQPTALPSAIVNRQSAIPQQSLSPQLPTPSSPQLRSSFSPQSSLTTEHAYDLLPHLIDSENAPGQKLLTTGLIDPNVSFWGQAPCRFLKHTFRHPRVNPGANLTPSLTRRLAQSIRPKIILAGLAKCFEAYLDVTGEYLGSVSTFTLFHPADDLQALKSLVDHLHSDAMNSHLISTLAANALRGQYITIKKSFLLDLPLP